MYPATCFEQATRLAITPLQTDQQVEAATIKYCDAQNTKHASEMRRLSELLAAAKRLKPEPAPKPDPGTGRDKGGTGKDKGDKIDESQRIPTSTGQLCGSCANHMISNRLQGGFPCFQDFFFGNCDGAKAKPPCRRCTDKFSGKGETIICDAARKWLKSIKPRLSHELLEKLKRGNHGA